MAELSDAGVAKTAEHSVKQLAALAKIRAEIDAAEAILLADAHELAQRASATTGDQTSLFGDELREQSARCYRVEPSNPELVRASLVTEVAIATRQTEQIVRNKLTISEGLRNLCPSTLSELSQGNITTKSATEIVRQSQDLEPEDVQQLEQVLLPIARTSSDHAVLKNAKRLRARMLPETPEERHETKFKARSVRWWAEEDGMAVLQAYLPATVVLAIVNTLNWHVAQHRDPEDERTDEQLRADTFRDVFLEGWPESQGAGVRARVALTIPAVEMLTDPRRALADLEGYGPIPMGLALQLAKDAPSMIRVLTDPWTGAAIDIGRSRYRPPQALRDFLRARDEHCRFPGCRRLPDTSEIDHIEDWAKGGETSRDNTRLMCKRHQMYKHALGWQSTYLPDGSVEWRSPHGVIQIELPGSIKCAQLFDPDPMRNPMLPTIELNEQVRRVLGWHDSPDQEAG